MKVKDNSRGISMSVADKYALTEISGNSNDHKSNHNPIVSSSISSRGSNTSKANQLMKPKLFGFFEMFT
jgi:hypothetical protein